MSAEDIEEDRGKRVALEKRQQELKAALEEEEEIRRGLEKDKKELRDQMKELRDSLKKERKQRRAEEASRAAVEAELKQHRENLDGIATTRSGMEEEILRLEKEAFYLRKQLDEIARASGLVSALDSKLRYSEAEAKQKAEERQLLENVVKRLETQLDSLKTRLEEQTLSRGAMTNDLEYKKQVLRRKLKTKGDIEQVLLEIEDDMATLQKRFKEEVAEKEQLEWMMNVEMQDLNRRLALETQAREKLKMSLEQALTLRQSLLNDVDRIKAKLSVTTSDTSISLTSSTSLSASDAAAATVEATLPPDRSPSVTMRPHSSQSRTSVSDHGPSDIIAMMKNLEKEFDLMNDSLVVDDTVESAGEVLSVLKELRARTDENDKRRNEMLERNESLEKEVSSLKLQLDEEASARKQLEQGLKEEREHRERLEKRLAHLFN